MYTVLCAFEDRQTALRSITRMIRTGLPRDDIHVQPESDSYVDTDGDDDGDGASSAFIAALARFFRRAARSNTPPGAEGTYRDAVRKGSTVIVVHVSDAEEALEAATLMTDLGAFDVEHCRTRWKVCR